MIFIAGARQCGKTTLSEEIASHYKSSTYRNWDIKNDKSEILQVPYFFEKMGSPDESKPLVILDEIHKYKRWKNYLKGTYDGYSDSYDFLVLGSGRLDVYQKGGDSLAGRYAIFTLWPLTLSEICNKRKKFEEFLKKPIVAMEHLEEIQSAWNRLSERSGFPKPYLEEKRSFYLRWSRSYGKQLIREDIRNMTQIQDIDTMEVLYEILPTKVGSALSILSLHRDLGVAPNSIKSWLSVFESLFLVRRIRPWHKKVSRAIRKEQKLYLLDYPRVKDPAARFENMVAMELIRATSSWTELGLGEFDLRYVRNLEKQEVDFLIVKDGEPWLLIECKESQEKPDAALYKFQNMLGVDVIQLIQTPDVYKIFRNGERRIVVCSATRWLPQLP